MKEKITPHLRAMLDNPFIARQYEKKNTEEIFAYNDPLMEEKHEVVKGLVHKYTNRALIKVSYLCAAHCRFCTRIRQIGNQEGTLTPEDIDNITLYLQQHTEIDDVILSGGDPLYTPQITYSLLQKIQTISSVRCIRIGTRLPLHSPVSFSSKPLQRILSLINEIGIQIPFYLLIHIEHPDELCEESVKVIKDLRKLNVTLLSQTVFLKEINDNTETLYRLFKELYHLGVMPYYLYHCDNVKGLENFQVDIEKEKIIAKELRERLSGIACPLHVIDIENGYGKIPL